MAPTEILAEQHFANSCRWFGPLGIQIQLRTGSTKGGQDRAARPEGIKHVQRDSPSGTLFIGTHALIQPGFQADNLGLVIIDEQHKFGVSQREEFLRKGKYPHLLVMTATPIPRTLGLTLYGDLDFSILDQIPPGRGRIHTFVRTADKLSKVWEFVRSQLVAGRQAYVVYPRVEEGSANGIKAVAREYDIVGFDPRGVGSSVPALSCDPGFFSGVRPNYIPANAAAEQVLINRAIRQS